MLAIRMQRTGRKGYAEFRIIVQDSRRTPTSGVIVAQLGHYSPHSKQVVVDKAKAGFYLEHGAQPSDRVIRLLTTEGIKMPAWVKATATQSKSIKNAEKLRKNRKEAPAAEQPAEVVESEPVSTETAEAPEAVAEEKVSEAKEANTDTTSTDTSNNEPEESGATAATQSDESESSPKTEDEKTETTDSTKKT